MVCTCIRVYLYRRRFFVEGILAFTSTHASRHTPMLKSNWKKKRYQRWEWNAALSNIVLHVSSGSAITKNHFSFLALSFSPYVWGGGVHRQERKCGNPSIFCFSFLAACCGCFSPAVLLAAVVYLSTFLMLRYAAPPPTFIYSLLLLFAAIQYIYIYICVFQGPTQLQWPR